MTEWLAQYERVAQRQQQYLQKIRDLRQRLQTKGEKHAILNIQRMRDRPLDPDHAPAKAGDYKSHVPWSSSLMAHNFYPRLSSLSPRSRCSDPGPQSSPKSERRGSNACVISGERLLPKMHPRRLGSLSFKSKREKPLRSSRSDMGLERTKTDYEPIEDIAKRNRIQFSRYLTSRDGKDEKTSSGANRDVTGRLSIVANMGDDVTPRNV